MQQESSREILGRFLSIPAADGSEVFRIFSSLPGAVTAAGDKPLQRYVFIPGAKKNAIVLVAHADTVWDTAYGKPAQSSVAFTDGIFRSATSSCGIGGDDRAGCAMLWALRDSGHSLLVVDGEEHGKVGANFLRKKNKKLFRKLNRHRFMMELDWAGTNSCLYNQVDNTQVFKDYIASQLGFQDAQQKGGCDLQILCQKICGVNIGVGYHDYHRPTETVVLEEWENTLQKLSAFLETDHPKFPIPIKKQMVAFLKRVKGKLGAIARKLKVLK